ncbi:MAG TPA: caspase family protein [Anaeromyxobacteraceae bacterium]|nr:caspase family protein [Anaeromyxobacteraceae bacterium]
MTFRAIAASLALLVPLAAGAVQGRVAVVAGSNQGAPGRAKLWFAEKDAERFERALRELGDFNTDQVELQRGQGAEAFRQALGRAEEKVKAARAAGEKTLLIVYFSGHAGNGGLEFANDRVTYDELKEAAAHSSAEAKIVIVDACEAGALTQVKGARAEARVDFLLPVDEVRGTAFIASTAVGEAAQESAAIGGSFFTHHLEVALRGAGDADGDGRVTMAEAFRYTASATVAATAGTLSGTQHPTYDFKMSGRGDVILSDLRRAEAKLLVPIDPGSLYVLKGPRGLVAEVPAGAMELALALPAGAYAVERRAREGRATGDVHLDRGETRMLPRLTPTRYEMARAKGGPMPTEWWLGAGGHYVGLPGAGVVPSLRAGLRREVGPFGLVVHGDYAFGSVRDGTLRYDYTRLGGGATLLYPLAGYRVLLEGGLDVGGGWNTQALHDGRHFETGDLTAAAALRLSMPIGRLRAALDLAGGARSLKLDDKRELRPALGLTLVVLYGL